MQTKVMLAGERERERFGCLGSDEGQQPPLSELPENKLSGPETCKSSAASNSKTDTPHGPHLTLGNGSQNPQVYKANEALQRKAMKTCHTDMKQN